MYRAATAASATPAQRAADADEPAPRAGAGERRGEKAPVCEVYGAVIKRGEARPRSVTAEEARRRARELGCEGAGGLKLVSLVRPSAQGAELEPQEAL